MTFPWLTFLGMLPLVAVVLVMLGLQARSGKAKAT